jgi:hypothetical protein
MKFPEIAILVLMLLQPLEDSPYRVLHIDRWEDMGEPGQNVYCVISLPASVNVEQLKKAICEVIHREKFGNYSKVRIAVFYGIKEYLEIPIDPIIPPNLDYGVGLYSSNPDIDKPGQLIVALDENGKPFKDGYLHLEFDHRKDCGCKSLQ